MNNIKFTAVITKVYNHCLHRSHIYGGYRSHGLTEDEHECEV